MSLFAPLDALDALAGKLPFGLLDLQQVNELYAAQQVAPEPERGRQIELWTYCFVRRYFLVRLLRYDGLGPADLEEAVSRTYGRIERGRPRLRCAARYGHWVQVVCRNSFVNFLRRSYRFVPLEESTEAHLVAEPVPSVRHPGVQRAVISAVDRLPGYLRPVARMRLLERRPYLEISELTERPIGTVRSYAHRAQQMLQDDAVLRAWAEGYVLLEG